MQFPEYVAKKFNNASGITFWFENNKWVLKEFPNHLPFPTEDEVRQWENDYNNDITIPKEELGKKLEADVNAFVMKRYEPHRQMTLTKLLLDARASNKSQAAAYVDSAWNWMSLAFGVYYKYADMIIKAKSKEELEQINWKVELEALDALDPKVTIQQTMALLKQ
jgi:hypothetical protein